MPNTINVLLQQDVSNLGKTGEVVRVRPGFARNFLLPRLLALPATKAQMNRLDHERRAAEARNVKAKAQAGVVAEQINALSIVLSRKAGESDKLYGAVTAKEIEQALSEKGIAVDKRKIELPEPIKALGSYEIPVKLGFEVTATIKVQVTKK